MKLPRKVGKERVYLSHAQVNALAENSGSKETLVLTLAYTGLRWGEVTGLLVRDLDALRRRVGVRQNAVAVAVGSKIIVGTPKTHKVRSVAFAAFLSIPLARQCEGKGRESMLFGDGDSYLRSDDATFPEHLTLHDLRHTAATSR